MRMPRRLLLTVLTAALTLALAAGVATANRAIQIEPVGSYTTTSPEVTITEEGGASVRCAVTLIGSLHRSIAKTRGTLAGFVTEGRTERCRTSFGTTATVTFLTTPSHIQYESFRGTLPSITGFVTIVKEVSLLIALRGLVGERVNECLYRGDISLESTGGAPGEITRLIIIDPLGPALVTALEQRGLPCARSGRLTGTLTSTRRIAIRLL